MARPRLPTNVLEMRGSFRRNPGRKRKGEPVPTAGIGPSPKRLTDKQRAIWDEIVLAAPHGVLMNSDRLALEILVTLLDEFRTNFEDFPGNRLSQMISLLGRFGFSPSDRSKVSVPGGKGRNEFDDI